MSKSINKIAIMMSLSSLSDDVLKCLSEKHVDDSVIELVRGMMETAVGNTRAGLHMPKEKSSELPKRSKPAYFYFCDDNRSLLAEKYPDMSTAERMKKMGENWKALSPEQKLPYEKMVKKQSKKEEPVKEKKPLNKYQIFCLKNRSSLKAENPNATFSELSSLLAKAWKDYKSSGSEDEASPAPTVVEEEKVEEKVEEVKEKTQKKSKSSSSAKHLGASVPSKESDDKPKQKSNRKTKVQTQEDDE